MDNIPQDVAEMICYKHWQKFSRRQKLDLINCAITSIFMEDKPELNKQERYRIALLDRMRKKEIIENWVKPKYDD